VAEVFEMNDEPSATESFYYAFRRKRKHKPKPKRAPTFDTRE
jgi:hypothetical protein